MFERLSWLGRLQFALAIAVVTFMIVLGVLALRTAMGKDPSLGTASEVQVRGTSSASGAGSGSAPGRVVPGASDDDSQYGEDDEGDDEDSDESPTGQDDPYDDSSGVIPYEQYGSSGGQSSGQSVAPMTTSQS
jgi:hypothetical protein